jgi:NAD(P)-dependent dehydrogenase (short-subunit alcohol dehydrogenase family)
MIWEERLMEPGVAMGGYVLLESSIALLHSPLNTLLLGHEADFYLSLRHQAADDIVREITSAGGTAVPNYDSVEFGDRIIATAIQHFGRIDVLINNAGILRDVSLKNMKDEDWDVIMKVHLTGTYKVRTYVTFFPFRHLSAPHLSSQIPV